MLGTAGRRLLSNSGWNLLAQGAGFVTALVAIPVLIGKLGTETFGIFSIYMAVVGYFGLLDLGIGRAVTSQVAHYDALGESRTMVASIATATAMLALLGVVGCGLVLLLREPILALLLRNSSGVDDDRAASLVILALTIPIVVVTSGFRGALEGLREFRGASQIATPVSILLFAAPALASAASPSLAAVMGAVLGVRLLGLLLFARAAQRRIHGLALVRFERAHARALLRSGGWMTVSNVVSPLMTNLDRVLVGTQVSMTAVAHYVTPYEMATRVPLGAGSIATAAFPEFVRLSSDGTDAARRHRHLLKTTALALAAVAVPAVIVFAFAHSILSLWLSPAFADESHVILRTLLVGAVVNGTCSIPFAFIQAAGRADITAKFHLLELCLYLPTLFGLLSLFGVQGAALAWVARVTLDAAFLFGYALRLLRATP